MKIAKRFFLVLIVATFCVAAAMAQNVDIDAIIKKYEANSVFDTTVSESTMTVKNRLGASTSSFQSYNKRSGETLIVVTEGADRGQKILRQESSVYLYYPDAEEVIRLNGGALKDSIMGSDYSYEDLTGDNSITANYTAELFGTETVDGVESYHVMLTAKTKKQKYKMQELWIDTKTFSYHKIVLYSASGKALRSMEAQSYITTDGYTIPDTIRTRDLLKKDSQTVMQIRSIKINNPIEDRYFSRDELTW